MKEQFVGSTQLTSNSSIPANISPFLDGIRPYIEYAAPFATVGSFLFASLSYLSERNQEKRLEEISRKLDNVISEITRLRIEFSQRLEDIQLRNISGGVLSISEQLKELTLINSDALLANIISESATLKHTIQVTLDSGSVDQNLKASYSVLLATLIPLRIDALGAAKAAPEAIFREVEAESLDFEFRLHQSRLNTLYLDKAVIDNSNLMFSEIVPSYSGPPPDVSGPAVRYGSDVAITWSFETRNDFVPAFLKHNIPEPGISHHLGIFRGPGTETMAQAQYNIAIAERSRIIREYFKRMAENYYPDAHIKNRHFRLALSEQLQRPKREIVFPLPGSGSSRQPYISVID